MDARLTFHTTDPPAIQDSGTGKNRQARPKMKLTDKQRAELQALEKTADEEINLSDIPERLDWSDAI